ncbi:MAG TPA: YbjQ family protein [Niabella sp.]|nr:YbjQ family protein [Niabella sp.]HQW14970.1 YbjQ family protein [Niabella sp.]HQX20138.1 YbjQ family protein [Niabella sp.]HRB06743.1 YbjQ family protein [Niabella sp.]HRB27588.1 YbjQ family protein [Niabella sp.]
MASPREILVTTTSTVEGIKVKKFLKPVTAHIVAGTNIFSDFFASITDTFGGRSQSYQKQLNSLYEEAIEKIKIAAYLLGANCVVGLKVDMDEISGKGKAMFMLSAIGTAVVIEKESIENISTQNQNEKLQNVSAELINIQRTKKEILSMVNSDSLVLNPDMWTFITNNQIVEVFPYLLKKYAKVLASLENDINNLPRFHQNLIQYIDALPETTKIDLLYDRIANEQNEKIVLKLAEIITELNLLNFEKTTLLLKSENFQTKKIGLNITKSDKPFYSKEDIINLQNLRQLVNESFPERGKRFSKKQLLSSKEKEVWTCECGKVNELENNCTYCNKDIFGFKEMEVSPSIVDKFLEEKIELIKDYLN